MRSNSAMVAVCFIVLVGCSKKQSGGEQSSTGSSQPTAQKTTAELLIGKWISKDGNLIEFRSDGSAATTRQGQIRQIVYKLSEDQRRIDIEKPGGGLVSQWQIVSINDVELVIISSGNQSSLRRAK